MNRNYKVKTRVQQAVIKWRVCQSFTKLKDPQSEHLRNPIIHNSIA